MPWMKKEADTDPVRMVLQDGRKAKICLSCVIGNETAHELYLANGFEDRGRVMYAGKELGKL